MGLPDYEPDPPFLLASLLSEVAFEEPASFAVDRSHRPDLNFQENTGMPLPQFERPCEEQEFDPDSYLQALENEIRHHEAEEGSGFESKGISFDPVAMGLEPGRQQEEETGITPHDFDFELLENNDEEKKS